MRGLLVVAMTAALGLGVASESRSATIVINNGLAPPNAGNVITSTSLDDVYVQNVGCDATVAYPCPQP
jgi:hypothetical protein